MGTTNPGPEYLRADEWRVIDRRRRSKRAWSVAVLVVVVVGGALSVWRVPTLVSAAKIRGVMQALRSAKSVSVVAFSYDADGVKQPLVWGEWVSGTQHRQALGHASVERRGLDEFLVDETSGGPIRGFDTASIDGKALLLWFLSEAQRDGLNRVQATEESGARAEYEAIRGAEKIRFWVDERAGRFVECVISHRGAKGWAPVALFEVELGAAFTSVLNSVDPRKTRTLAPLSDVEARLPLGAGNAIEIGPLHVSESGTVFLVVRTGQTLVQPYITDNLGTTYFATGLRRSWPEKPAVEYMFVPVTPTKPQDRTISVHFPSRSPAGNETLPPRDIAVYDRVFAKASCKVVPPYRFDYSATSFDTRIDEAVTRANHLREVVRYSDGDILDVAAGEVARRGSEVPSARGEDRKRAIQAYRDALTWMALSGRVAVVTRATLWFRLYDLESQFGDPELAKECLETAFVVLGREGFEVDGALIRQAHRGTLD